ncbi:MAG: cytochrome c oxidase subunit II [Pontixanthobacter sp.]
MIFGDLPRGVFRVVVTLWAAAVLALAPQLAVAQDGPAPEAAPQTTSAPAEVVTAPAATEATVDDAAKASTYKPLGPEMIKGQPIDRGITVQEQYSPIGKLAAKFHIGLVWVMVVISVFVLGLLMWVMVRFRRGANETPSKTTHNTFIEVVWTLVPVLVLVGIAIPSITLLSRQYESPPENAVTIKATGYQWYWGYSYPDNGDFEIISNMLPEEEALKRGEPAQLAVDNRMVVPANTPLRIQTTAADVIHSFAVPSLWFKIDAVPGRLNERLLTITEPGIYYGQCSELCGARHGYMPIAVEALPRAEWEAWVVAQGGTVGKKKAPEAAVPAAAPAAEAAPAETAPAEAAPAE